jgi:DNA-binding protein HU-beta
MNKGKLIAIVAKDLNISKVLAEKAVNSILDNIKDNTRKGVNLVGFGSFSISKRAARNGRNPRTGATIRIPARRTVRFKAGKDFRDLIQ